MSSANLDALAGRVRDLRTERSWSQEHLAGAAGLSLRTIQRVESGYTCAGDTLLALAAAFEIPASELTKHIQPPRSAGERFLGMTGKQSAWTGLILALPALLFVVANLVNEQWGVKWAAGYLANAAPPLGLDSPVVIVGGLTLALFLNFFHTVRFDVRRPGVGIIIDRLQLRLTLGPVLVVAVAVTCFAVIGVYLVAENVAHLVAAFAAR